MSYAIARQCIQSTKKPQAAPVKKKSLSKSMNLTIDSEFSDKKIMRSDSNMSYEEKKATIDSMFSQTEPWIGNH